MDDADFTRVFEEDNPSVAYDIFVAIFTKILNDTCPLRRLKRGSTEFPKKPWITQGILNSISRKNELYKIYLGEPSVINFQQFKNYRNTLNGLKRKAEKMYLQNEFMKHKCDMKKTWKTVNSLLGQKGKIEVINKLQTERGNLTTPNDVANYLRDYFSNEEAKLCDDARKRIKRHPKIVQSEIPVENQLVFNVCSISEVSTIISRIQSNSSGVDGISLKIAKSVKSVITPVVCNLINKSIEKGIFPEVLKVAKIIPLHKGGKRDDPSNKRPISILPFFSKIYEKVIGCQAN